MSSKVRDKVTTHEFVMATAMTPEQIRQAGDRAGQAAKRSLQSSVTQVHAGPTALGYHIKGPGGLVTLMTMLVSWTEERDSPRMVSLTVGDFVTNQPRVLAVIPIGPKDAPAMKSLARFSAWLQKELSGA